MTYNAIFMATLPQMFSALFGWTFILTAIGHFFDAKRSESDEHTYSHIATGVVFLLFGIACILITILT